MCVDRNDPFLTVADNTLLNIPSESVPPQAIVQPPPYVAPPPPAEDRQKSQKYQDILKNSQPGLRAYLDDEKQPNAYRKPHYSQDIYDPRHNVQQYDNRESHLDQQRISNYEYQRACDRQTVHMHNARNQQLNSPARDLTQQFYTLPTRRPQREAEPPRSVTPDITRGLGHGSLSGNMHMLAQQSQRLADNEQVQCSSQASLGRGNLERAETRGIYVQTQPTVVDVRNRLILIIYLMYK